MNWIRCWAVPALVVGLWVGAPADAQDMSFEPRLAERWERLDDLTMRFYLRKGVKFHSGNPFTAKDVKFTFERFYKSADFKGLFAPFDGCTIIDDHTIDIKTKNFKSDFDVP